MGFGIPRKKPEAGVVYGIFDKDGKLIVKTIETRIKLAFCNEMGWNEKKLIGRWRAKIKKMGFTINQYDLNGNLMKENV